MKTHLPQTYIPPDNRTMGTIVLGFLSRKYQLSEDSPRDEANYERLLGNRLLGLFGLSEYDARRFIEDARRVNVSDLTVMQGNEPSASVLQLREKDTYGIFTSACRLASREGGLELLGQQIQDAYTDYLRYEKNRKAQGKPSNVKVLTHIVDRALRR